MRSLLHLLGTALLAATLASAASASEGVLEISQACAAVGCFPGDGPGFPVTIDRGQPATFPLNGVIKCWTEGVQLMKVGGKSRLVCPSDIAYGDQGRPGIPPGAVLIFEVELISIESAS